MAASMGGDHAGAVRLAACADAQRSRLVMPLADPDRVFLDRQLAVSREALGNAVADAEEHGRELDLETALAVASRLQQR